MGKRSDDKTGLIAAVACYFALVGVAGLLGWYVQKQRLSKEKKFTEDGLSAHYLSGRSLGTTVTALSVFASLFSGYTVVGVPNEAFSLGFVSLRWVAAVLVIIVGYMGTGPRLRKASLVRNHQSPTDFITDRFGSQVLRYTIFFLQLFPTIIYLIAQVISIKITFNSMFGIDINNPAAVIIVSAIIVCYEWLGGLSCVAWTDSLQAIILLVMFMILPITFSNAFGGWVNLDPMAFPKPTFYQTPDANTQYSMWNFMMLLSGFFTLPHFIQRTYAAESMKGLKVGYTVAATGGWLLMIVGVYLGTMGVEILKDQPTPASPFAAIMEALMDYSLFGYVVACVAYVAGVAGIMSTADSLLIAISQLVTSEVLYPLFPSASPARMSIAGKLVSLLAMGLSLLVALLSKTGLSSLAAIQFGLSMQTLPAFLFGLYAKPGNGWSNLHPWSLAFGALAGFVSTICIFELYVKSSPNWQVDAGVTGCVINFICCALFEVVLRMWMRSPKIKGVRSVPQWDKPKLTRFGDVPLTADLLWKSMKGIYEPFLQGWYLPLVLVLSVAMLPLSGNGLPPLDSEGKLAFPPNTFAGVPDWSFAMLMFSVVLTCIVLYATWQIPNEFPDMVDPTEVHTAQLLKPELSRRFSYDAPNVTARDRRSTISRLSIASAIKELSPVEESLKHEAPEKTDIQDSAV